MAQQEPNPMGEVIRQQLGESLPLIAIALFLLGGVALLFKARKFGWFFIGVGGAAALLHLWVSGELVGLFEALSSWSSGGGPPDAF